MAREHSVFTARHPWAYPLRVEQLRLARRVADRRAGTRFARAQAVDRLPVVVARHGSILRRRLGATDPRLQETKIVNLRLAAAMLDGLVVRPGETLSFWDRVGAPSARRGFQDGIVLFGAEARTGTGGGLCQMANLLYWLALHTPLTVVERHHHGFDPFPDDRRILPFGTGASVFYNYVDLRLRNDTDATFQVDAWLTERDLEGRIRADRQQSLAYHVYEVDHRFERDGDAVVRCNQVRRRAVDRVTGVTVADETLMVNRSRVAYPVDASVVRPVPAAGRLGAT
jgi:vancomycin resistance protein VanW